MSVSVEAMLSPPYRIVGNRKETVTNVTMDSSYQEKGEKLTPAQLGFTSFVDSAQSLIKEVKGTVNVANAHYERAKELLHLFDETPAEVASEANVEGIVVQVTAQGI